MMSEKHFLRRIAMTWLSLTVMFSFVRVPLRAQEWPPITPEESAMTDCPQQPGAPAVCLYHEEVTNHEMLEQSVYKRLKILTAAGRDQANIEIPYYQGIQLVEDIEARVVTPEGQSREFDGQIYDKTALRGRGIRIIVKTFALPDVEPGSIIDYRYKIVPDYSGSSGGDVSDILTELQLIKGKPEEGGYPKSSELLSLPAVHWDVQSDLFTLKARFEYITHPLIWDLFNGLCRLSWVSRGFGLHEPQIKGSRIELEVENIPPFEEEDFMTPEDAERMTVDVFYLDRRISDFDEFWKRECECWQKSVEGYIGNTKKLAAEVRTIIGDVTDPTARLQKIYERAQNIRNLSYEKSLTRKQRKEQKIKDNRKVSDVLERNYGLRSDITRTFVALARAAGFEASVARVSTRDDKLFSVELLTFYDQLDSEVALVKLGDKNLIFDPATPFCPFGLIHWSRTDSTAIRVSDKPPAFIRTSIYTPDLALTQREIVLRLDLEGNLAGSVKTTYTGHEALVRRLDQMNNDQQEIRKSMEEELSELLPMGADVTMIRLDNIDTNDPALIVTYDITIPGIAAPAGDRMLLPVSPLLGTQQYPFRHAERQYPVYFPYPFREFNDIIINLPEGMTVEIRPAPRKNQTDFSSYALVCVHEAPQKLHVQRDLVMTKIFFPLEKYAPLKAFYDNVRTNDEEHIVLVRENKSK